MYSIIFLAVMGILITFIVVMVSWSHKCIYMSEFTKLYTLNVFSFFYTNYNSLKLEKKEKKTVLKVFLMVWKDTCAKDDLPAGIF